MVLEPRREGDRFVYEHSDTRTLTLSGGRTVVTSWAREVLERVGIFDPDALEVEDVEVEQNYMIDPVRGEVVCENRIRLDDASVLEDLPQLEAPAPSAD